VLDRIFLKFFSWLDRLQEQIEDVSTFDVGQELNKKKKRKGDKNG